jgi:outer membrane protein OmpA-like peptidoglycan-associated protein
MNFLTNNNPKMRNFTLYLLLALSLGWQPLTAQSSGTPKDMTEVGVNVGALFVTGDVSPEFGLGYGVHIRKATDYVFSLRLDAMAGTAQGMSPTRDFETRWLSVTGLGVFSLNNVRFDRSAKKLNYYALAGAGANSFNTDFNTSDPEPGEPRKDKVDAEWAPHVTVGAGISFRINKQINIGIEHQATRLFGKRTDLIDGFGIGDGTSVFTDLVQFTSIQVNYNLGNPSNRSEPLYWASLGAAIVNDLDEVKKRQDEALADSDNDGVIDAVDQEPNTPAGVPVDTKGRTLDSDKDGVADYKDLEPYYPPRAGEEVNEDGVVINPIMNGGGGVTEERVQEMIDEALAKYGLTEPKNSVAEWFLPMVHFGMDAYTVKYSDYGTLASIARMMKSNPELRLVVTGYTDQTGTEAYNAGLSYQRARAVVEHLTNQHGIGRGRLVLQWKGQDDALVPNTASYMNRRVEFRVAEAGDYEMDPPADTGKKADDGY